MKFRFITLAIAMFALAASTLKAQVSEESRIKVLPTDQVGHLKVLYAMEADEKVEIKFFNRGGEIATDKIKGNFPNGILKKYDVRNINSKNFWVEVSSPGVAVTYRIVPSKDGRKFIPYLEKTVYNHTMVAKK